MLLTIITVISLVCLVVGIVFMIKHWERPEEGFYWFIALASVGLVGLIVCVVVWWTKIEVTDYNQTGVDVQELDVQELDVQELLSKMEKDLDIYQDEKRRVPIQLAAMNNLLLNHQLFRMRWNQLSRETKKQLVVRYRPILNAIKSTHTKKW